MLSKTFLPAKGHSGKRRDATKRMSAATASGSGSLGSAFISLCARNHRSTSFASVSASPEAAKNRSRVKNFVFARAEGVRAPLSGVSRSKNREDLGIMLRHGHRHGYQPRSSMEPNDSELDESDSGDRVGLLQPRPGGGGGRPDQVDWRVTGFAFLFPAIGGLLFGWDIGTTSGALTSIMDPNTSGVDWYALDSFQQGMVVSTSLAGALLASAAAAVKVGDEFGSKKELQLAALFYGAGAIVQGLAPSLGVLIMGRFTYGLGIGLAMHAAPMYIAETAPPSVRGLLISLKEGFIVGGIMLGYLGSYVIFGQDEGWRSLLSTPAVPAALLMLGMSRLPDSPRWLLQRGRPASEAREALEQVRGKKANRDIVDAEMARMVSSDHHVGGINELFRRENLRPLYIGISVVLFQQITGQPSVLYYAEQVFINAGYDPADGAGVAVILGFFKLLMTGVAVAFVDSAGRRPLLLGGVGIMTLSVLTLAVCSETMASGDVAGTSFTARASVAAIFAYVGAYQVSFGPIAWLLVGEIFPQRVRSAAVGTATLTNFFSNFLVSLYLPTLNENLGTAGTYYLFSVMSVVALSSIYLTVPETKGKTLEEIEESLR